MINNFNKDYFEFISKHADNDTASLKLKYSNTNFDFSLDSALLQIELRRRCRKKLSKTLSNPYFIFPDKISSEQATDENVASYHVSLAKDATTVIDMTTGLGIDAISMAQAGKDVTAIEIIKEKYDALKYNVEILKLDKLLHLVNSDSIEYGASQNNQFDLLFIDPARRDSNNRRTYSFKDCIPDVASNQELLFKLSPHILIKASPLLDINHILKELNYVKFLHIIDKDNDCKEILVELELNSEFKGVKIINILDYNNFVTTFFSPSELCNNKAPIAGKDDLKVGSYLYEPQPSLMKLNAYGAICEKFTGLKKLSPNTSLYISENLFEKFPGRILKIGNFLKNSELKKYKGEAFNVAVRNYPLSADQLRNKYKFKEGVDSFIYGAKVTSTESIIHIICDRMHCT